MFKSFKSLKTVRTLFDQAGNLYRVAKRVLEKVGSRFRSGYKRFSKNSLFYTEALPTVTGVTGSYTKGAGFESINQSQVTGLRSFSAYDIIGASSIDDQYLTFKPNVSSSDYPKPTFDPDDSVGAGIFTKSLWNHNLVFSSNPGPSVFPFNNSNVESFEIDENPVEGATAWEIKSKVANPGGCFMIRSDEIEATWDWDNYNIIFSLYVKFPDPDNLPSFIEVRVADATQPQRHSGFNISPSDLSSGNWAYSSEDAGNGWYRVSYKAQLTGYNEGLTFNGDKLYIFAYLHTDGIGKKAWISAPQIEKHPLNKPSWSHNQFSGYDEWVEGSGSQLPDWGQVGSVDDNKREYRTDPFGKQSVVWVADDDPASDQDAHDGGIRTAKFSVDTSKEYRASFFMKVNSPDLGVAQINLGYGNGYDPDAVLIRLTESPSTPTSNNQYAIALNGTHFDGSPYNPSEWYLVVYYLKPEGTANPSYTAGTGLYDLEGNFLGLPYSLPDWGMTSATLTTGIEVRVYNNPNNTGQEIEYWGLRMDAVDGNEPSISDLLNPVDNPNYPPVTKATPYVGNDAIPANVHRHNWLNYTNDLATSSNWNFTRVDLQPSTIGTSVYSGETAYEVVPDDPIGNWPIIYTSGDGISFNADETKVASVYIKSHDKNPTFMPAINSNLSGFDKWRVGTGDDPSSDWIEVPDLDENERLYLDTPFGGLDVVWRATNLDGTQNDGEGGYRSTHFNIDRTKKYRFSQFVRTSTHNDTSIYLGQTDSQSVDPTNRRVIKGDDGLPAENFHYFATGYGLPSSDEWYLMVAHIHPEGTSTPIKDAETGLYDMSGNLVDNSASFRDFVFSSTTTETMIRGLSYYNRSANPDTVDFWHPRVDAIDGNEPSIERLLDSVKAKQPAVNFPAFAEIPWLDEGLTDFWNTSGWNAVDTANATTTTSSLKTPFNTEEVVVVANNEPSPDGAYEGGISTHGTFFLPIDNTKKYRYSIFAKKATNEGGIYLGPSNGSDPSIAVRRLDNGTHNNNPYFINNRDFGTSEWVLLVGHIWPHTTAVGTAKDPDTGVWLMDGTKLLEYTTDIDLMTSSTTTEQGFRAFFYGDVTDDLNKAYFWQPRIDIVDGTEPSIEELLRLQPGLTINLLDFSAPTKIHRAAFGVDASGAVYPKYIIGGELDGFGVEEVGDGWYRAWAYKEGLDSVSNTVEGDDLYYYLYFGDAAQPFADVSATINNDFRSTLIMKPMVERLGIDQVVSNPPTAYQEVSDNTWPSVSAIPYHQVAKEVELSIKDDTTGSSYTAKAYWDGGKLYNYGPRIANQDVEITQLQDGWHKFGTGIRGLGDGTINTGDTASMTFSYAASSNPRSKTLISGPILANTGSEKSSKVNYSVGTNTPEKNLLPSPLSDYFGSLLLGANIVGLSSIDHNAPGDTSAYLMHVNDGGNGFRGRDEIFLDTIPAGLCRASDYDTIVAQLPVKSLWNYNQLPYSRTMDNTSTWWTNQYATSSSVYTSPYGTPAQVTVSPGPDGPWGSQGLVVVSNSIYNDNPIHPADENLVVVMSVFIRRPDDPSKTPENILIRLGESDRPNTSGPGMWFYWYDPSQPPYAGQNSQQHSYGHVEDYGDNWYRLSIATRYKEFMEQFPSCRNSDSFNFEIQTYDRTEGNEFIIADPQIETHEASDTNLLKPSLDWYTGVSGYGNMGNWTLEHESTVDLREDPFGLSSLCVVGTDTSFGDVKDGGFASSPNVLVDPNSTYRYSMFFKLYPEPSGTRSTLIGPKSTANTTYRVRDISTGNANTNPYFGQFVENVIGNDWVLFVGHIQPSGTAPGSSNHADTGIYSLDGTKLSNYTIDDFMWDSTTTQQGIRGFGWASTANPPDDDDGTDAINLWSPRVEKVDGTEPSISELLASGNLWTNPNYQQTLPSPYVENVGFHPNSRRENWLPVDTTRKYFDANHWSQGAAAGPNDGAVLAIQQKGGNDWPTYRGYMTVSGGPASIQIAPKIANSADIRDNLITSVYLGKDDENYVASVYIKPHESDCPDKIYIGLWDRNVPANGFADAAVFINLTDASTVRSVQSLGTGITGGYEILSGVDYAPGLGYPNDMSGVAMRVWANIDSSAFINSLAGVSALDEMVYRIGVYDGTVDFFNPMLERIPNTKPFKDVPTSYSESAELGVTSIPEHQCAAELKNFIFDYDAPYNSEVATFKFNGGVVEDATSLSDRMMTSKEYLGDGWYNCKFAVSSMSVEANTFEGDRVYIKPYYAERANDVSGVCYGLFGQPFLGLTGSLTTSSVDYNP
jgi:hypothetical protein